MHVPDRSALWWLWQIIVARFSLLFLRFRRFWSHNNIRWQIKLSFGIPQRLKRYEPTSLQDFARIAGTIHSTHVSHAKHVLDTPLANVDEVRDPCGRRLQSKHHSKPSNGETDNWRYTGWWCLWRGFLSDSSYLCCGLCGILLERKNWWVGRPRDWNWNRSGAGRGLLTLWRCASRWFTCTKSCGEISTVDNQVAKRTTPADASVYVYRKPGKKVWHMRNKRYAILIELDKSLDWFDHFVLTLPCSFHETLNILSI